jgi:hypothetical protein
MTGNDAKSVAELGLDTRPHDRAATMRATRRLGQAVCSGLQRASKVMRRGVNEVRFRATMRFSLNGAAQESNLPSVGLRHLLSDSSDGG